MDWRLTELGGVVCCDVDVSNTILVIDGREERAFEGWFKLLWCLSASRKRVERRILIIVYVIEAHEIEIREKMNRYEGTYCLIRCRCRLVYNQ